ncbi:MAG: hypothetical protein RSE46_01280, partial [Janthinobacterium sp.]
LAPVQLRKLRDKADPFGWLHDLLPVWWVCRVRQHRHGKIPPFPLFYEDIAFFFVGKTPRRTPAEILVDSQNRLVVRCAHVCNAVQVLKKHIPGQ